MRAFGFVFARGGSKGLPGKNLLPLGGVPLVGRAVRSGLDSGVIERMFVSTDDAAIAEAARGHGAEVPFLRPEELAADDAPEWLAWRHAVDNVDDCDVFVSLPATSPLRTADDVRACVAAYTRGGCDIVITVRAAQRHPSFNMVTIGADGLARLAMPPDAAITRRQDAPKVFDMTTVAYVTSPGFIRRASGAFEGRVRAVEIPPERALDIDDELDYRFARFLLEDTP